MKIECNVVLDLLPLYIDGAVSEESKVVVEEHLKECAACDTACADMRSRMDAAQLVQAETAAMNQAAHTLRKRRRRRVWRNVLIGLVVGVVLVIAVWQCWTYLRTDFHPIPLDEYKISLNQIADTQTLGVERDIVLSTWCMDDTRYWYRKTYSERDENGCQIKYLTAERPTIPEEFNFRTKFQQGMEWSISDGQIDGCDEIRQGTPDNYVTLWRKGEDLPAASKEMRAYIEAMWELGNTVTQEEQPNLPGWPATNLEGDIYSIQYRLKTQEEVEALNAELFRLMDLVPEWQ